MQSDLFYGSILAAFAVATVLLLALCQYLQGGET